MYDLVQISYEQARSMLENLSLRDSQNIPAYLSMWSNMGFIKKNTLEEVEAWFNDAVPINFTIAEQKAARICRDKYMQVIDELQAKIKLQALVVAEQGIV